MDKFLKISYLFIYVSFICGCQYHKSLPVRYIRYAPAEESLTFVNDSICVYKHARFSQKGQSYLHIDTCRWEYVGNHRLVLRNINYNVSFTPIDSNFKANMNFLYDICPKWYNIEDEEFYNYVAYRYPYFLNRKMSSVHAGITFYTMYAVPYTITCDTISVANGYCLGMAKNKIDNANPAFFLTDKKQKNKLIEDFQRWSIDYTENHFFTNTYEYRNYYTNCRKKVHLDRYKLRGRLFTCLVDSFSKESVRFINDTTCIVSSFSRDEVTSSYMPKFSDTCRYTIQNNLIAIDFSHNGWPSDTLSYSNGILFYSKVYKDYGGKEGMTHLVKPFISETKRWKNRNDSINHIMHSYLKVYVPINLYKASHQ